MVNVNMEMGESNIRSTKVEKPLELEFDLGNLMASDPNEIQIKMLRYLMIRIRIPAHQPTSPLTVC